MQLQLPFLTLTNSCACVNNFPRFIALPLLARGSSCDGSFSSRHTLTLADVAMLAHAFWPSDSTIAPAEEERGPGTSYAGGPRGRAHRLLASGGGDDDDDDF